MPRIEFEADSEDELVALAWRWVMGPQRQPRASSAALRDLGVTGETHVH